MSAETPDRVRSPAKSQNKLLCEYVRNTGQVPLRVLDFDDDWEPAGAMYRQSLVDDGLITEQGGGIVLTDAGKALADGE